MKINFNQTKKCVLDTLFPLKCLGCGREGFWLCPDCIKKVKFKKNQTCPDDSKKLLLSSLTVVCDYQNELIQKALHFLKYKYAYEIKVFFDQLLTDFFKSNKIFGCKKYLVIPIPLHKKRLKFRGFNQSEIIASTIARILKAKLSSENLIRKRYTKPQVGLPAQIRKNNIKGVFSLKNPLEISHKSVMLIDDVYTTGSTMNEAARILKKAGATDIIGLVIARV